MNEQAIYNVTSEFRTFQYRYFGRIMVVLFNRSISTINSKYSILKAVPKKKALKKVKRYSFRFWSHTFYENRKRKFLTIEMQAIH